MDRFVAGISFSAQRRLPRRTGVLRIRGNLAEAGTKFINLGANGTGATATATATDTRQAVDKREEHHRASRRSESEMDDAIRN